MSSDSFVLAADKKPDLANNFLTHELYLFRSLQIDCAGGYLDCRPKIRLAGDGIPKAAGRAKLLMKNLPRATDRKSPGEDFDFLQLSGQQFDALLDLQAPCPQPLERLLGFGNDELAVKKVAEERC